MALLLYCCCSQEYWLLLPVLEAKCECIIMLCVICSVHLLLGSRFVLFCQDGHHAYRPLGCCKGKAQSWFPAAVQKAVNAAGVKAVACWPEGKAGRAWTRWFVLTPFQSCCWLAISELVLENHVTGRLLASLSSLRLCLPGVEDLLADLPLALGRQKHQPLSWPGAQQRETWGQAHSLLAKSSVSGVWMCVEFVRSTLMTQQPSAPVAYSFFSPILGLPSLHCMPFCA